MHRRRPIALDEIEAAASDLLDRYGREIAAIKAPPIPVGEILECLLGFEMEFSDLEKKYGSGTLAEMHLSPQLIVIDATLDPEVTPKNEGRYNFTLGHETGHWILHSRELLARAAMPSLFDASEPAVVCRSKSREPREREADLFATALLMPREMVLAAWKKECPGEKSVNVRDEIEEKRKNFGLLPGAPPPNCELAKWFARTFKVSAQSMQIRLQELKLLEIGPHVEDLL